MALSRLDNLLKSIRGNVIYVDKHNLDATDSIENRGNSKIRPFINLQRAIAECVRFSYQKGLNNDRFATTTIVVGSGTYDIDNRPGYITDYTTENRYISRTGEVTTEFQEWDLNTNFDINSSDNAFYKLNSIHGGVILPRGCSLVSAHSDVRKTVFRPKYVPNPENDNIERSAIFRLTGANFLWGFTILDSAPNGVCYKDYTTNTYVPNFSHHKLTCFEYCDGTNPVDIQDVFLTYPVNRNSDTRTDLDMYYEKIGLVYGISSSREISPDYSGPSIVVDIQAKIDEYRIVGPAGGEISISSIRAGNGVISTPTITVSLESGVAGLDVDTAFQIEGIIGYTGQYVVSDVIATDVDGTTEFNYQVQNAPTNPAPSVVGAILSLNVDTVTSASPYIFNISLRSVYGMCGVHADGSKASGFKSMVVAQFTGIGLQKDNKAFVKYNSKTGTYEDSSYSGNENIHSDSLARFNPSYENFHIKASNNAFMQLVSIFAIGYAIHFVTESGGDFSITNSNSNFGAKALQASGFRSTAFNRDDVGYITHIIPPKQLTTAENGIEFYAIDVAKTISDGTSSKLYLYGQNTLGAPPQNVIEGYRIGAKSNDTLNLLISSTEYSARIVFNDTNISKEKKYTVAKTITGDNDISGNVLTFTSNHTFSTGESIRLYSNNGRLPDGIEHNRLYYVITTGLNANKIKIAQTLNDAISNSTITINNLGGVIDVISSVSDKNSGDISHPIQWDVTNSQWYIKTSPTDNTLYTQIALLGTAVLGATTSRTYIKRKQDTRNLIDTIYRIRYVIPSGSGIPYARPPLDGFILQESNSVSNPTNSITNVNDLRNSKFIANATWSGNTANIFTELPHSLSIGSQVEITNVTSTNDATVEYNGTFDVVGISSAKHFSVNISSNPGTFTNDTSVRDSSLPQFVRKRYSGTYYIYRSQEIKKYIPGKQDGIYHLIVLNSSNSPTVAPFTDLRFSQSVKNLYPQQNRDEPESNPKSSISFALPSMIGQVVTDDPKNSITRETIDRTFIDTRVGFGITNIVSNSTGIAHTIHTDIDHGFNRITTVSVTAGGVGYGYGVAGHLYNAQLVGVSTGAHATAKLTVNSVGNITEVKIIDGGSAYGVGNTLTIVGVPTFTGYVPALLTVSHIYNNEGDSIRISGVSSESYSGYNDIYRITSIPNTKSIIVSSASSITNYSTVGATLTENAYGYLTGNTLNVSSLVYDKSTGIATVTTSQNHALQVDNKIRLSGATADLYNGDFIVTNVVGLTTFILNIAVSASNPATSGTIYAYRNGAIANSGNVSLEDENIGGRMISEYAGITTTLSVGISDAITSSISITDISTLNIDVGDYLIIDNEIVRVTAAVSGNPITVLRGILGTRAISHVNNSVVRRIKCIPTELRRNSIIRASGHTFEYIGFGPGNYSTALPERQDRILSSQEELLAQSLKIDGGASVYTGMDSDGNSYAGNKKLNYAAGQEEIFDAPIPTVVGEDFSSSGTYNIITPSDVSINNSLRVEGGANNNIISQFDGPVIFNNKITSTSDKGIESTAFFIQGDVTVSRKYTVSDTAPVLSGNPGDIVYNANPTNGGSVGWIYTTNNGWYDFGNIGEIIYASKFIKNGATPTNYLRANGDDTPMTDEVISDALGYVPANSAAVSGSFPAGNSIILQDISTYFTGIVTNFNLRSNVGAAFTPIGSSANLIVSLGGVIQQPIIDFNIVQVGGNNTDVIQFTTAPIAGLGCFIVGLGGQGALTADPTWTTKGDLIVGAANKVSAILPVGVNGAVLSVNSDSPLGVGWTTPTSSNVANTIVVRNGSGGFSAGIVSVTELRSTGNVTAYYSDLRLKENINPIENALPKLLSLRGVTYNSNKLAEEFGYADKKIQVGVIAQDVEKVLPQVVVPAPFDIGVNEYGKEISISGDNYKTVQYEKIVPLLIEAIKDQQNIILDLQNRLEFLESK